VRGADGEVLGEGADIHDPGLQTCTQCALWAAGFTNCDHPCAKIVFFIELSAAVLKVEIMAWP